MSGGTTAGASPFEGSAAQLQDLLNAWASHADLFDRMPIGLAFVDLEYRYVRVNARLAAMNRMQPSDIVGRFVRDVIPGIWPQIEMLYTSVVRDVAVHNIEIAALVRANDPTSRHVHVCGFPVLDNDSMIGIGVLVNDVTETALYHHKLDIRSDQYAMISRATRAIAERHTAQDIFEDICRIVVETGHFRFACISVPAADRPWQVTSAGDDRGYMKEVVQATRGNALRHHGLLGYAAATGTTQIVNNYASSARMKPWHHIAQRVGFASMGAFPVLERGRVTAVLGVYADRVDFFTPELVDTLNEVVANVSHAVDSIANQRDHIRDDAALRLRNRALNVVPQGISISDASLGDFPLVYVSPGFERLTGYTKDEVIGRNCRFLSGPSTDPTARRTLADAIRRQQSCTVEILNYRKDGSTFWNEVTVTPLFDDKGTLTHFVGMQCDVTARRNLELATRHGQKIEAVGQLASGVAHDFNNLLTVIGGCSEMLLEDLGPNHPLRSLALDIRSASEHGAALTRQLLAFSRKQVVAPQILNVNDSVRNSEPLLVRLIGESVLLRTELSPTLWSTFADGGQIEQILINLAVNARDAMPDGGQLLISTCNVNVPDDTGSVPEGEYVQLTVADTGTGISAEAKEKIFDPFWTTKSDGKGTGLGLSTVLGIVTQANGHITVESDSGAGATFIVWLPRDQSFARELTPAHGQTALSIGSETLLLVEDDDAVRALGRHILSACGYTVHEAAHGSAALDFLRGYDGVLHMLVSDVVMPHMGGRRLAEAVRELRPECRVLFVSGYTDDEVLRHGIVESEVAFLHKPYTPTSLAQAVRRVLDAV